MSIKYYRLAKDEEPPEEFCAVRDVNGEPSEYTWYERVSEFYRDLWVPFAQSDWFAGSEYRKLQAENAKLRELVRDMWDFYCVVPDEPYASKEELDFSVEVWRRMRELGIEV